MISYSVEFQVDVRASSVEEALEKAEEKMAQLDYIKAIIVEKNTLDMCVVEE